MTRVKTAGKIGLVLGAGGLSLGLALAIGSAMVAGDWWLAREPWIGWGLRLIVAGLAVTAVASVALIAVMALGWWRLLAVPPGLLLIAAWAYYLLWGQPTSGFGGATTDLPTILYSDPRVLVLLVGLTLLLALPLLIGVVRGGRSGVEE